MKKQTLAIIGIIAVGSLFSIVYATGTVISDSGIITPSLTVNGNQIGEGSYTSWAITGNVTDEGDLGNKSPNSLIIDGNGNLFCSTSSGSKLLNKNGTPFYFHTVGTTIANGKNVAVAQSTASGKYQITFDGTNNKIRIFNNLSNIANITINTSAVFDSFNLPPDIAISPDGKYIGLCGQGLGLGNAVQVWQGS